jgi:hypothetical protein
MSIRSIKAQIIDNIIVRGTFDGGLQRSRVYLDGESTPEQRKAFRHYLFRELRDLLEDILEREHYIDNDHYRTITTFARTVSRHPEFRHFLVDHTLRIGTAQKLINLYWKMNWLLKPNFPLPIHCPFDSIIIRELDRSVQHIRWTQFNAIDDYKKLVRAARVAAGNRSIAEWELERYSTRTIPDME